MDDFFSSTAAMLSEYLVADEHYFDDYLNPAGAARLGAPHRLASTKDGLTTSALPPVSPPARTIHP